MTSRPLPPTVERFVAASVPSVMHLEALLLLRARGDEEVTVGALAKALYVAPEAAARVLADLVEQQLVRKRVPGGSFVFGPATPELRERVDELAATYRERLVPLHEFIHERAAANSIKDFANAFRIRKD